jgi:TonB family protein
MNGKRVQDLMTLMWYASPSPDEDKRRMMNLKATQMVPRTVAKMLIVLLVAAPVFAQTPNPPKPSTLPFSLAIQLLTDPEGIDLGPYMRSVYKSVKEKALTTMPPSVSSGDQGVVRIRLRIQKDGTLPSPTLPSIILSSGKKALDDNAMGAVSKAAPYEHLPEQLSAPSIELRLTFSYNITPQK